jgi:Phage tail lysozyme
MLVKPSDLAEECVQQAIFFGVNPHYMVAVASMRSQFNNDTAGDLVGPFRLTQAEWDANRSSSEFGVELDPTDIKFWDQQCLVFAFMTYQTQNKLAAKLSRLPSAVELYQEQWPKDTVKLPDAMQAALDAMAALIGPAADKVLGGPMDPSPIITDPGTPTPDIPTDPGLGRGRALFRRKAPGIMDKLMAEFQLSDLQAAGVLGNIGEECNGFRTFQEQHPRAGRGGFGWCQWTADRRVKFEKFCQDKNVSTTSDEGNYGFLELELTTTFKNVVPHLRAKSNLKDAVTVFEAEFEIAGVAALNVRTSYAQTALDAFKQSKAQV